MTLIEDAKSGITEGTIASLAALEGLAPEKLAKLIATGKVVAPCNERNAKRERKLSCIGESTSIKVNANVGTSRGASSLEGEVEKAQMAESCGAHTVMDLSTGGDLRAVRRRIVEGVNIPVGTVPIYEPFTAKPPAEVDEDEFFSSIERHIEDGVDFLTIHAGITKESLEHINRSERILGIVSRGGSLTACWI
ncbi:MAG: phosphomethylpyrimidine synthase ThiC, partial [Methermicoccaceae archaeon]